MADECVNTIKPIESSHGRIKELFYFLSIAFLSDFFFFTLYYFNSKIYALSSGAFINL